MTKVFIVQHSVSTKKFRYELYIISENEGFVYISQFAGNISDAHTHTWKYVKKK